jgi:hypothetical protein
MKIGIVIPAHNEVMTIAKCLASVRSAIEQLPSTIKAYPLVVLVAVLIIRSPSSKPLVLITYAVTINVWEG